MPGPTHNPDPTIYVTCRDINTDEIFRRRGQGMGDEDFEFTKCPLCNAIFLVDEEHLTIYLDPDDLTNREAHGEICPNCVRRWIIENRSLTDWDVTWDEFEQSDWSWAATRPAPK